MLETEIKEQIITQAKNVKFLQETIIEIDSLPEEDADKRADEYMFCQDKLFNSDYLDDEITRRRILHEMKKYKDIYPDVPNLYKELIQVAILELKKNDFIYWLDDRYFCKEGFSNKAIIKYLIRNYFNKPIRFGGCIERNEFKNWVCEVFTTMRFAFSEDSIKKQIDAEL